MIKNVFEASVTEELIDRVNKLSDKSLGEWGEMSVAQMLAHCNVTYELVYESIHSKPTPFVKYILKLFVKSKVVGDGEYPPNSRTAPQFIIKDARDFEAEKQRLINYLRKTQELGESHFEALESHSFGPLSSKEWNNMFYKHLDHHLNQFGV